MTVKELREKLEAFPDDAKVLTRKTDMGSVGNVFTVKGGSYGVFGRTVPCVLLTDECEDEEE